MRINLMESNELPATQLLTISRRFFALVLRINPSVVASRGSEQASCLAGLSSWLSIREPYEGRLFRRPKIRLPSKFLARRHTELSIRFPDSR